MWAPAIIFAATSIVLWQLAGGVFIPELLANWCFAWLPVSWIEAGVLTLGPLAKTVGFAGWTILYFGAYLGFAWLWPRAASWLVNSYAFAAMLLAGHAFLLFPLTGFGVFGYRLPQGALSSMLILAVSHLFFGRFLGSEPVRIQFSPARRWILAAFGGAAGIFGGWKAWTLVFGHEGRVTNGDGRFPNIDGLSLEITPVGAFYRVSKNSVDPVVRETGWTLSIGGLVERPETFTLADLQRLPAQRLFATLACISNPVGGDWIGNAEWTGVPLRAVLDRAGVRSAARDLVIRAADGYEDSIPMDRALHPESLLAYQMNGQTLTHEHGFPLRLIVPGIYGMKNVKWITSLEPVAEDFRGFWQRKGWDDAATYNTMSRIDTARNGQVAGIAFGGDRGISRVEVFVDGQWRDAALKTPATGPLSWTLWHLAAAAGGQTLMVRATDGSGAVQTRQPSPPFPSGSTGWHRVTGA